MTFCQDGGPALNVMKGNEAWIMFDGAELKIIYMRHVFGTVQKSSLGVEGFRGAQRIGHSKSFMLMIIIPPVGRFSHGLITLRQKEMWTSSCETCVRVWLFTFCSVHANESTWHWSSCRDSIMIKNFYKCFFV